ncbi:MULTISPECIES: hypothetical protein [Vibrio]|uniref:Uncharacterized protein n=1 Tax=Vibrio splendidus TaxID=29497 RepID=A0A2N7JSF7_VIBSP|nr:MULTISPECIES: hypothetical protein [Vibrio]PMM58219.1 hypothetical protein BCT54_21075 [Vibrio splendidus]TCV13497.1 hypothetical protein EDB13_104300 [Vibrio crassostreae]
MPNNKMSSNHQSSIGKQKSAVQIELRFKLMEAISRDNHNIEITDEILKAIESDKALFSFSGVIEGINLDCGLSEFEPITRNTVNNHGKLERIQLRREEVKIKLLTPLAETTAVNCPVPKNLTKSEELEEEKLKVKKLNSDLASLRTAYKHLLNKVKRKLPLDPEIDSIVRSHNQKSLTRQRVKMKVIK